MNTDNKPILKEDKTQTPDLSNKVIDNPSDPFGFKAAIDKAYCLGVEHSISIVEEYRNAGYTHHAMGAIIERLTNLKNKK